MKVVSGNGLSYHVKHYYPRESVLISKFVVFKTLLLVNSSISSVTDKLRSYDIMQMKYLHV